MYRVIIIYFFLLVKVSLEDLKQNFSIYGGVESLIGSRVKNPENKGNFLIQYKTDNLFQISLERRGVRDLSSFEYKNKYIYFSVGHRYKPINGFYFLRDTYFYSAFQNPSHGIIQQPLNRSGFLGGEWKDWGLGIFHGANVSNKKPGLYLRSPSDILGIAYSPETEIGFFSLNLRNINYFSGTFLSTISSQAYGLKNNYFGYFNQRTMIIPGKLELYSSLTKDDKLNSLQINQDSFGSIPERMGAHLKMSYNFYNRLEHFSEIFKYGRESVTGGNSALFTTQQGSLCIGGRYYDKKEFLEKDFKKIYQITAGSLSWEWKRNSEEFILRIEERENRDRVLELKSTIRPIQDWRLEISALMNKKNNQIRSLYEQWSDGENINTIFTDRESALKLKIIGSFVVLNLSGSRTKEGSEIFYSNLQFKFEF